MSYSNPIVAGDVLIREAIKSENYVPGVSGWAIFRNGDAEFNNIIARGDITADSLIVPFTNQSGEDYRIAIEKANADQPNISFEFDGGNDIPTWSNGSIDIEAFDNPSGWGETTWEPLQPFGFLLGSRPRIRLQSHHANGQAGRVDVLGATALGDGSADDRPIFQVGAAFDVLIASLRHQHVEEPTDLALAATGAYQIGDGLLTYTGLYPASGVVTIHVNFRGNNSVANGITGMSFRIRDTNSGGTIRYTPSQDKRAEVRHPTAGTTTNGDYVETVAGLPTGGVMFIEGMYVGSNATTANFVHRTMDVIPSP